MSPDLWPPSGLLPFRPSPAFDWSLFPAEKSLYVKWIQIFSNTNLASAAEIPILTNNARYFTEHELKPDNKSKNFNLCRLNLNASRITSAGQKKRTTNQHAYSFVVNIQRYKQRIQIKNTSVALIRRFMLQQRYKRVLLHHKAICSIKWTFPNLHIMLQVENHRASRI